MRVDQAVILIAPEGRPGKRILGLDPLERVLLTASQAGVTDFILVGADGVDGEAILASLRRDKRFQERDIRPEYVPLSGLAELGRRGRIRGRFWLMEEALVFSPDILDRALRSCPGGKADLIVVNRRASTGDGEYAGLALLAADALASLGDALRGRGASAGASRERRSPDRGRLGSRPDRISAKRPRPGGRSGGPGAISSGPPGSRPTGSSRGTSTATSPRS